MRKVPFLPDCEWRLMVMDMKKSAPAGGGDSTINGNPKNGKPFTWDILLSSECV